MMWTWRGLALLVLAQADKITAPEIESGDCKMAPAQYTPGVKQYAIECDWTVRGVNLQIVTDSDATVYGPTGRVRAEGKTATAKVLLFFALLPTIKVEIGNTAAFADEFTITFKLRKPPSDKVTSRSMVWMDDEGERHSIMGRALPEINSGVLPGSGIVQITGQPFKNFENCAFESGLTMGTGSTSKDYWVHINCKQDSVDLGQFVLAGMHLDANDIKCEMTPSCADEKHHVDFAPLDLLLKKSPYKGGAYMVNVWAGAKKGKWDMYECSRMELMCKVKDQTIDVTISATDSFRVDEIIDESPIVPHCMDARLLKVELPKSYDPEGQRLTDQVCDNRGSGGNFLFFCPPTVDTVEVEAFVADPSAVVLAWGIQQSNAELYRDGTVSYKWRAPVGTMGCKEMHCERGPFNIDVICGEESGTYQTTIANPAGVTANGINFNPLGDVMKPNGKIKNSDCKIDPPWKSHIFEYSITCNTSASVPLYFPSPEEIFDLSSEKQTIRAKWKSHARGEMDFTNEEETIPGHIWMRPAEKFDLEMVVEKPPPKDPRAKKPTYTFHMQRVGSLKLLFEPFPFAEMAKGYTGGINDGGNCSTTPKWDPKVYEYDIHCSDTMKEIPFHLPPPDEVKNQMVDVEFSNNKQGDMNFLSDPTVDEVPEKLQVELGEQFDVKISVETPVEGPIYTFHIKRDAGLVSADAADALAKLVQAIGGGLAIMSGGNLVTVVKFIQFMGIFNELKAVPEAYGDFVKEFDSVSLKLDPSALYKSEFVVKLKEKLKEHFHFLASFMITEEDVENYFLQMLAPQFLGDEAKGLTMHELKTKFKKEFRTIKRQVMAKKKEYEKDAKTCMAAFGVPVVVIMILIWSCIMNNIVYRVAPSMIPQAGVRQFELIPGLLLLMDLGLIGFCRTAKKMIFEGKDLEVPLLYHPGEEERKKLMIFMICLYPMMFMLLVLAASFWLHKQLVYNRQLKQFTDRQCVEIDASQPVYGGLLENRVRAVTPITEDFGHAVNEAPEADRSGELLELLKRCFLTIFTCTLWDRYKGFECKRCKAKKELGDMTFGPNKDGKTTLWPKTISEGLKFNYPGSIVPDFSEECAEEMNTTVNSAGGIGIDEYGKPRKSTCPNLVNVVDEKEHEDEDYVAVKLNSASFRGEAGIGVHSSYAAVPNALHAEKPSESTTPLLPGVSPSAFVYRLSNVYDDFPDAKVGRLAMNVPTVRPRLAPGLDEENAGTDYAVNPMKPEVVCRDIPGLNWYMPRTVIEVPKKNLGYQYSGMFSTILTSQKKARYQYLLSRLITVVSIFGLAIVAVVQEKAEAAAKKAEAEAEAAAIAQAKQMEKAAEHGAHNIFTPILHALNDLKQMFEDFMKYCFPTTALEQMLLLCVQPGLELFGEIQQAYNDASDGADPILGFGFAAGVAALCSRIGAFIHAFIDGPCVVLFSQVFLVFTMMVCTAEFPLANFQQGLLPDLDLLKEQNAALALICVSGLSILVINGAYFGKQTMKAFGYAAKIPAKFEKQMKKVTRFDWKGFTGCDITINYTGCDVLKCCKSPIPPSTLSQKWYNQAHFVFFALPLTVLILYAWKFSCHLFIQVYPPKKHHDYVPCTILSDEYDNLAAGFFLLLFIAFFTCFDIMGSLKWKKENIQETVCKQFWVMRWLLWLFRDIPYNLYKLFCAPEEERKELFNLMKSEVWGVVRQTCPVDTIKEYWNTYCYGTTSIPGAACGAGALGCTGLVSFISAWSAGALAWAHSFLCCVGFLYTGLLAGCGGACAAMAGCDAYIVLPGTLYERCMEAVCDRCNGKGKAVAPAGNDAYEKMNLAGTNNGDSNADKDWFVFDKDDTTAW